MRLFHRSPIAIGTLAASLALLLVPVPVAVPGPPDAQLELGVKQVEGGEFDAAVATLDGVARRLANGGEPKDRVRAYTYLAIAYLGLAQEQSAKARFLEALKAEPGLRLDPKEFPPKVVQFFEQVRATQAAPTPAASPSPTATSNAAAVETTPVPQKKGGGSKTALIILGGAAAVGGGVAIAGGGSSSSSSPATITTTLPPATASLANLSARASSAQDGRSLNCTEPVLLTVALTNTAPALVQVSGVRSHFTVATNGCKTPQDFTYAASNTSIGTGTANVLNNKSLFSSGSGCCSSLPCSGKSCEFGMSFTVLTSVGEVNAGGISFGVTFKGCAACSSAAGFDAASCPATPQ